MSVASDSPSKGDSDETSDKSFVCPSSGCNQKFDSEDSLRVHKQKHQMTLTLGPSKLSSLADVLPVDQTPTPTRFLHYGNQMGLFDELNPFDKEFTKTAQKDGMTAKQRRVAQQLHWQALNKAKSPSTPTRVFSSQDGTAFSMAGQPLQVIAITPTLPSPITALPSGTNPFFCSPLLPSPQGLHLPALPGYTATSPMQVPANILSPTLMPFTPGLLPGIPTSFVDAQQRAAAFTQAMFAAAASAVTTMPSDSTSFSAPSPHALANSSAVTSGPSASLTDTNVRRSESLTIPSIILPKQERPMSVSSSTSESNNFPELPNNINMQQQNVQTSEAFQSDNTGNSLHQYPMMGFNGQTTCVTPSSFAINSQPHQVQSSVNQHQVAAQQSESSHPLLAHRHSSEFGSNPNLVDAKQKLKETLTSNNPNLQTQGIVSQQNQAFSNHMSHDATEQKVPGRKRGRQSQDIDPDIKRQRFLERNRAAASRCRNKKKQWVCGLETKAKSLSQVNVQLQNEIASLKDEVATLKQLLLSHRDCPIMKMQQHSMSLAGINLDLSSSSSVAIKSESQPPVSGHLPLSSTLSNNSLDGSTSQQNLAPTSLPNGSIYSSMSSS